MHRITATVTSLSVVVALLAACTSADPGSSSPDPGVPGPRGAAAPVDGDDPFVLPDDLELATSALHGFDACEDLLDHLTGAALDQVGPWGLGDGRWGGTFAEGEAVDDVDEAVDLDAEVTADAPARASADDAAGRELVEGEDFSGTNVQEVGVDEPDRVKTDGDTMYAVAGERLRILDVTADDPQPLAELELHGAHDAQLLLEGDRLLVTTSTYAAVPFAGEWDGDAAVEHAGGTTTMTLIDVADPTRPAVRERLTVDGRTVSSRSVDGVARVVVSTAPDHLPWVGPEGGGLRAERAATQANRDLIRGSEVADWLPYLVHETADGTTTERPLLACDRVARPPTFAGLDVLSVLTVDLDEGLLPGDEAVGVLAGGDTVYASPDRLYVATTAWRDWEAMSDRQRRTASEDTTTEIHAFDITDPRTTAYLASGTVPGTLLSQWSLSEHDGHLRVASTVGADWWTGFGEHGEPSASLVTVLRIQAGELSQVGQVGGLGPTERIYAVRFMGDVGYVVTFRQTDPLYTLDLADPAEPRATGELKILGYSAYLHPVGEDLLIGVGQDADELGVTRGTQLSLFDVADPADPRRIDQVTIEDGTSDVEHDHRAFLHWPATGLTVVPFQRWSFDHETGREDVSSGALTFTVTREEGIRPARTLSHLPLLRDAFDAEDTELGVPGDRDADDRFDDLDVLGGSGQAETPSVEPVPDGSTSDAVAGDEWWVWEWSHRAAIGRSMVRGDRLVTLSDAGVATHDLDTLADTGWLRLAD